MSGAPDDAARASVRDRSEPVSVRPLPAPGAATVPANRDSGSAVKPSASSTVRPDGSSSE